MRTPPLRPFLKCPLPRPPANTCALRTRSFVFNFSAIFRASSLVFATPKFGTVIPASFSKE